MLMYGDTIYGNMDADTIILKLATFSEANFPKLNFLIPPPNIGVTGSYEFDVNYANYILSYDNAFIELFDIILALENGKDVFIMVSKDDWVENLIESLCKLIQQRYGYNAVCINSEDDYTHFKNEVFNFNPDYGLYNLDMDRERYSLLLETRRISNGGQPWRMI